MTIRISGLNSGLDTDSIIAELVKASSSKKESLTKAQTKLSWKQDAWKSLNTKIYSFFNSTLSNMRFSSSYNKKTTTVSNANIASVVAGDNAVSGTQSLVVKQLAKAGYLTGGKLSDDKSIKSTSTLNGTPGINAGLTGAGEINVTVGGKTSTISVTGDSTVSSVISQLNGAGVQASFDATNQRIFINVANSGEENDFTLSANNANGLTALSKLGLLTQSDITGNAEYQEWAALKGADDSATATNLATKITSTSATRASSLQTSITSLKNNITTYQDSISNSTTGYQTLLDGITSSQAYVDITGTTSAEKLATVQNKITAVSEKLEYIALKDKDSASLTEAETTRLAELETKATDENWGTLDKDALTTEKTELQATLKTVNKAISYESSIATANKKIYDAHVAIADKAYILNNYYNDQIDHNSALTSEEITALHEKVTANNQGISDGNTFATTFTTTYPAVTVDPIPTAASYNLVSKVTDELVEKVNTAVTALDSASDLTSGSAVRVSGQSAIIELNGAEFESSSNSFTVNGLTITAKQVSEITGYSDGFNDQNEAIKIPIYAEASVNTDSDITGVYDMVKKFFTGYNTLINEIDSLYNSTSAKGYEPLTDDEKATMTDDQIKDWEDKIKDALLRKDSSLGSVVSTMKQSMLSSINISGSSYTLSSFGIETLGYFNAADNERGAYHIDGDSTDSSSSGNTDKLKTLISSDPQLVTDFFTKLSENLYTKLNTQMRSTEYRSVYNVYDDKKMKSDYSSYTTKISAAEAKLTALEDRYYKQFSAMEVALSKLSSSQSAISGLLGS